MTIATGVPSGRASAGSSGQAAPFLTTAGTIVGVGPGPAGGAGYAGDGTLTVEVGDGQPALIFQGDRFVQDLPGGGAGVLGELRHGASSPGRRAGQ